MNLAMESLYKDLVAGTFERLEISSSARGINSLIVTPPRRTGAEGELYSVWMTSGAGSASAVVDNWFWDASGSARATLVGAVIDYGSYASGCAAGTYFLSNYNGTTWDNHHGTLNMSGASALTCVIKQSPVNITKFAGRHAEAAWITVSEAAVRVTFDGTTPQNSGDTPPLGLYFAVGDSIIMRGRENIDNFKAIAASSSACGIIDVQCFF